METATDVSIIERPIGAREVEAEEKALRTAAVATAAVAAITSEVTDRRPLALYNSDRR